MNKYLSILLLGSVLLGGNALKAQEARRIPAQGFATHSEHGNFQPYDFTRHAVGDNDILIEIMYSGICHSDIHTVHGDWGKRTYPFVPGHEIAGRVAAVGKNVMKFKVGDYAGVGCLVNACLQCENCKAGNEHECHNQVLTYADKDIYHDGEITQGGYANNIVVSENFVVKIPAKADMKRVAPLLCAGVTTYSPIKFSHVKAGDKVAVAGFGGLGHLAVKYLVKLGAEVTVFDVTDDKAKAALDMGAVKYVNVNKQEELKDMTNRFCFLLSTVPVDYDMSVYFKMLSKAIVGVPAMNTMPSIDINTLVHAEHRSVYGSQIGGIALTQEAVNYSVENNIYPDVQVLNADAQEIDEAYRNVQDGKVQFRYVLDMSTLK